MDTAVEAAQALADKFNHIFCNVLTWPFIIANQFNSNKKYQLYNTVDDDIRYDNIAIFLHYVKMKYTTIQWVLCCCTRKFIVSGQSLHITFVSTPMYSFLHFILYISVREILSIRIIISQQFRSYFPSRVNILCL